MTAKKKLVSELTEHQRAENKLILLFQQNVILKFENPFPTPPALNQSIK